MKRGIVIAIVSILGACSISGIALAQTTNQTPNPGDTVITADAGGGPQVQIPNTTNCFDHYTFGSIEVHLTPSIDKTVSGAPLTFTGTIKNDNPYPIVSGTLYAKVFKVRKASDGNGPDVVDQFMVKDNIVIPAQGSVPVSITWNVPSYAVSGDYRLAPFFSVSHSLNLLGLYFSDDVIGEAVPFTISGEQQSAVTFDRTTAKLNDKPYYFVAGTPNIPQKELGVIEITVKNTSGESQTAIVSWRIAHWDAGVDENVIDNKQQTVTIPAKSSAPVTVTVTDTHYPVYEVLGTMNWHDARSIIGVRFVRDGIEMPRINFSALTSYPQAGQPTTLFSCVHDMGSGLVQNGRLELNIKDAEGNVVHTYTYTGAIPSAMTGVAENFTPTDTLRSFTLDSKLYDGNTLVDESKQTYNCKDINPSICPMESSSQSLLTTMWITVALVSLVVLCLYLRRRWKKADTFPPPASIT